MENSSFCLSSTAFTPSCKCPQCGSHELENQRVYQIEDSYEVSLPCDCGTANEGAAAVKTGYILTEWLDSGPFDEDEPWTYEDTEWINEVEREVIDYEVFCTDCVEVSVDDAWDFECTASEEVQSETSICCTACGYVLTEDEYPEALR